MRLYEIGAELRTALAELDAADGALEGDLEMRLDMCEVAFAEKVEGCLAIAAERQAEADAMAEAGRKLLARAKVQENSVQRLRDYVEACMRGAGARSVKTRLFTATIQRNPARLVITGEVPEAFTEVVTTTKPRTAAIKQALSDGLDLDFAHMEQTESLRVRS
jgi:hypothetical protein